MTEPELRAGTLVEVDRGVDNHSRYFLTVTVSVVPFREIMG